MAIDIIREADWLKIAQGSVGTRPSLDQHTLNPHAQVIDDAWDKIAYDFEHSPFSADFLNSWTEHSRKLLSYWKARVRSYVDALNGQQERFGETVYLPWDTKIAVTRIGLEPPQDENGLRIVQESVRSSDEVRVVYTIQDKPIPGEPPTIKSSIKDENNVTTRLYEAQFRGDLISNFRRTLFLMDPEGKYKPDSYTRVLDLISHLEHFNELKKRDQALVDIS